MKFPPGEYVHFSELKKHALSAAHYAHAVSQPRERARPGPMLFGSTVHALILGGARVAVFNGDARRGTAWKDFEAEHGDDPEILLVTAPEFARASAAAQAVFDHPDAGPLVTSPTALREYELAWKFQGRPCAGRLDALDIRERRIVEVKTDKCAEPETFGWRALRLYYHAQAAWYLDGVSEALAVAAGEAARVEIEDVFLVVVESTPPHPVVVRRMTLRALEKGRALCRKWMEKHLACEQAGAWPGYTQSILDLDVPETLEESLQWPADADDEEEDETAA